MVQEQQELERLRSALWPADGRSPGAETLVDVPSPLKPLDDAADAEAHGRRAMRRPQPIQRTPPGPQRPLQQGPDARAGGLR